MSYKIKRLFVISIVIIILALAANEGTKDLPIEPAGRNIGIPYVPSPVQIDPNAIEESIPIPKAVVPKPPVVTKPIISAESYLVGNLETGEIYAEHNSRTVFPIASLSKLITALVALHYIPGEQKIAITQSMLDSYGDAGHLILGETFTASELLYPLLLESSNDAALAFAESYGYDAFIQRMNAFAMQIGMTSTFFRDPSGLSAANISNAKDLFTLARFLYVNEKPLLAITKTPVMTLATTTEHGGHIFHTINPFPFDPHFIGGKTGRTNEAKESMVSLFRYDHGLVSYPVAVIVLRSDFSVREIDSALLFERFIEKINKI